MELKKIGIAFLRVFGVCALIGGMVLLLVKLESREAVFQADFILIWYYVVVVF